MPALKWTEEVLREEAMKYSTRREFEKLNCGAYQASRRKGEDFHNRMCSHMEAKSKIWNEEEILEEAKKYRTRSDFQIGNSSAYNAARKRGIKFCDLIFSHMERLCEKWTEDKLIKEAKKYKTRSDFIRKSASAYNVSLSRGRYFLDTICSHMEVRLESWNIDKLRKEAIKFKTRGEFRGKSVNAYSAAQKRGIMNDICSHMDDGVRGFKRLKGGFLYQFRVVLGRKIYYKVGISNHDPLVRATQFGIKDGVYIEQTHAIWFEDGAECRQMEKELHTAAKAKGLQYIGRDLMKSGFTEIFTKPLLN